MKNLDLLLTFTLKEISLKYKHAVFGFSWLVVHPILQMLVIGMIFQFFIRVQIDNYFLFLLSGLLVWNFFSLALVKAVPSIVYERGLIQKASFAREVIPLSIVLSIFFQLVIHFVLFLPVLLIVQLWQGGIGSILLVVSSWLLVIPILVWVLMLAVGLALGLAVYQVKYRDVQLAVQALLPLWFYASPILYTLDFLPEALRTFLYLNPLTWVFESLHWILLGIRPIRMDLWWLGMVSGLVIFFWSLKLFQQKQKYFIDWL